MKKTKLAVLFTAFMAMMGLSSCLGDPDPYNTLTEIMKVEGFYGYYSFKSAGGYTVSPTNAETLTGSLDAGGYALVNYKYDTRTVVQGLNNIDAEILGLMSIDELEQAYEKTESNAPIYVVQPPRINNYGVLMNFYDKTNMFIDLTYYYNKLSDSEEQKAELDKHDFYLYQATAEEDEDVKDNTIVLYLIHTVADPENNEKRITAGTETRHFDLSYYTTDEPEKIIIKFKQSDGKKMDDAKESKVEIPYKSIIDQYFSNSSTM